jgi:hypothetical protein
MSKVHFVSRDKPHFTICSKPISDRSKFTRNEAEVTCKTCRVVMMSIKSMERKREEQPK